MEEVEAVVVDRERMNVVVFATTVLEGALGIRILAAESCMVGFFEDGASLAQLASFFLWASGRGSGGWCRGREREKA